MRLTRIPVGAGLPAIAVDQSIYLSADTPLSQASQLPQGNAAPRSGVAVALLLIWLLILGAPLNHDGRRQVLRSGHPGRMPG
ncbi:hypothetical protein GDV60_17425 [Pseudomonas sp. DTU12.1]|nr:hypothetical protein GDV60_17425 [Pseudomonas sp. DTU12.1]